MESLPEEMKDEVFDILRKRDKLYVIMKEENEKAEELFSKLLGSDNLEFMELFDVMEGRLLKEFGECVSIINNEPFINKIGLKSITQFFYDLSRLDQTQKVLFNYALTGRRGNEGLLQSLGGEKLSRSSVYIPSENGEKFESFIKRWGVEYKKRKMLVFEED